MTKTKQLEMEAFVVLPEETEEPVEVGWTSGHVIATAIVIAYAAVLFVICANGVIR